MGVVGKVGGGVVWGGERGKLDRELGGGVKIMMK